MAGLTAFLVLTFTVFFNNAIQWYTHIESYPLQAYVGKAEYNTYGQVYEHKLGLALYLPYSIMLLANLALFFVRPVQIEIGWLVIIFLLNLSIMVVSLTLAVPIHKRHAREGLVTQAGVRELLRVNLIRLGAASASSLIVGFLLARLLTP